MRCHQRVELSFLGAKALVHTTSLRCTSLHSAEITVISGMPVVADERGTTVQLQHTCMALTTADVTDVLETAPCSPVLFDQLSSPHLHRLRPSRRRISHSSRRTPCRKTNGQLMWPFIAYIHNLDPWRRDIGPVGMVAEDWANRFLVEHCRWQMGTQMSDVFCWLLTKRRVFEQADGRQLQA